MYLRRSLLVIACLMLATMTTRAATGPTSSQSPYMLGVAPGVTLTSILTVGDAAGGYKMAGLPDGLGAFDNGNGTFTLLMNHELGNTAGIARTHNLAVNGKGAFVSEWVINKSTLQVLSGQDLIYSVVTDPAGGSLSFNRFCSADLPAVSAYYNASSGLGTTDRIFMNGEETGGGRAFGHVVTGGSAHTSFELPLLGKFAHENVVANPFAQDKTIVAGTDDTTPQSPGAPTNNGGRVYVYVGTKTSSGTPVAMAGLTNGINYAIQVSGTNLELRDFGLGASSLVKSAPFSLVTLGGTQFMRPEDAAWDPNRPGDLYFVTTDRIDQVKDGIGSQIARTRLWRARFVDIRNPLAGGVIDMLLDGTEAGQMYDNLTIDRHGRALLQEDPGGAAHNAKAWSYDLATGALTLIAKHDPARFGDIGVSATAPFNNDEETSGIIDVSDILGDGMFLLDVQAHYSLPGELVEGGQILAMYVPPAATTKTITDEFLGDLLVSAGESVRIQGGHVTGDITMAGGSLILSGATVDGSVEITGGWFSIDPSTINGNLQIHDTPAGAPASQVCDVTINGNLHFQNNASAARIGSPSTGCAGNNIGVNVIVMNNTAPVEVTANKLRVNLQCRNNVAITGKDNVARQKQGQCAGY